jgi:hypothetical protein
MALDITVAGNRIPTDATALKDLRNDLNLAFSLEGKVAAILDTTLDKVPASGAITSVAYTSANQTWTPGAGPVEFGLQGGAKGTLQVVNGGTLVSYTDGLDQPESKSVSIPADVSYVSLTLNFNISANASATYSNGAYGVKAALDTSATYAIQFCKAFAPSTVLRTAIAEVFQSFVLPLHQQTLSQLSDGDYLLHEFDGNLHLAFGAYAGLDKVLYAGQSSIDVLKSCGSPLATLAASAVTEVKAGVGLDFKLSYASRFETLLTKSGTTAKLHLFRSANISTATTLKAGLTFDTATTASLTGHTEALQSSVVSAAGGPDTPAGKAVGKVLSAGASALGSYADDCTDKLTSWVNKADGLHANLQVAIETSKTRTILAGYNFDLSSPAFPAAWQAAIAGDFLEAMQTGAVTLDLGSGLEQAYQRKTAFSCNFFNLWSMQTWDEFSSKVSLVYAGNNVFHLAADIGRTLETQSVGAMHSLDFYFTVNANVSLAGQASATRIDLHVDLTAQSDAKAISAIATMLSAIEAGPVSDTLARSMHAFATNAKKGTAQLQVTIPASAYAKINCDVYSNGKPATTSTYNDALNWRAFAQAAGDLNAWPLQRWPALQSFAKWAEWNELANGVSAPNRLNPGSATQWPEDFPQTDDVGTRALIANSLLAGQSFMNFCADLRDLIQATDTGAVAITWNSLIQMVTGAIKNDVEIDFARPTALAIVRLCGTQTAVVSGPVIAPVNHFAVTIQLQ